MTESMRAEMIEWQVRAADLQNSVERLREERDAARSSIDLLMHESASLEQKIHDQQSIIDRLRLHIAQGIEL